MSVQLLLKNLGKFPSVRHASSAIASVQEVLKDNGSESNLTSLSNGFHVASYSDNKGIATVGVWVDSGAKIENSDNNGVASLFEHLLYSGTQKKSGQQLQNELAKVGARLSSFSSRDHTAYYAQCLASDVDKVVDILADVIQNTNFTDAQIEEQRSVVLKKMDEFESNYREVTFDNLHKTAFQGTPYSLSPLGSKEIVEKLTKKDIQDYVDDSYKGARMVLAGAGGVDHDALVRLAEKHFSGVGNGYNRKVPDPGLKAGTRFTGSEFAYRDDSYPHLFAALAVEGVPRNHPDYLALQIASQAVGQYDKSTQMSGNAPSQLAQKISAQKSVVAYDNFSLSYDTAGLFGFYFVSDGHCADETHTTLCTILREWKHLANGVTDKELVRVKNQLITNLFSRLETNTALANYIATEASVQGAMTRHAYDRDFAISSLGLADALPDWLIIRYSMSSWRL
uniref:Uncharacterized protein n=1 Tax=Ditylenchus dipsaci TaxID=166011 RepID=A0A915E2D4_9BILA